MISLPTDGPRYSPQLEFAARLIAAGGVVAYPTEGVYGVGCLPTEDRAIRRILQIKRRSWRKGLAVIAASIEQLQPLVVLPAGGLHPEIAASWPGPVTWVLKARRGVSELITGGRGTIAVRITDHALARALCLRTGSALVSTSANYSGRPPARSALRVRRAIGREIDYVLAGPLGHQSRPTEIRFWQSGEILRAG